LERDGYDRERMSILAPDPRGRYTRPPAANADPKARVFTPVAIHGVGAAAVTGPMRAALTGGGLIEALTKAGFAEPDARHYFESLRRGQALIAAPSPAERVENAVEVMRRLGARAVDETEFDGAQTPAAKPEASPQAAPPAVTVPVVEEQIEIGKRQVSRGGVRINSHIVEEPVEERVSLREERLVVERRPVYRDATEADLVDFKEGTIEIHETVEEPVISKRRRVVEEIVIGRETRERVETVSDTVRRTRIEVEQIGDETAARFGSALARDERFRGSEWDAIEPDARREWERENAGAWDQFKDAVRGAWQKATGR
jgi:uncharacterized protein (TIGR02271 family)